ncbi:MAG: hypothetical protein H6981_05440 [Gammaproteobacteria bacterium]|nr:hypothetical protein [Gammaproteobacteria bacterium]
MRTDFPAVQKAPRSKREYNNLSRDWQRWIDREREYKNSGSSNEYHDICRAYEIWESQYNYDSLPD